MTSIALIPSQAAALQSTDAEQRQGAVKDDAELRRAAKEFEAAFIAEMLTYAGFDKALSSRSGFGGEAFSRMLVESYATSISENGGFGIAEKIYRQLKD